MTAGSAAARGPVTGGVVGVREKWRRTRARWQDRPRAADAGVALLVQAAVSVPWLLPRGPGQEPADLTAYLLTTVTVLPLLWRSRAPATVLLACMGTLGLYTAALDGPGQTLPYTALVALYTVGSACPSPRRQTLLVLSLATVFPATAWNTGELRELVFSLIVLTGSYGFGRLARVRQEYTRAVEERAEQLELTRHAEAERAAVRERARIAREMHDVLAHAVSLMVVQAEAGPVAVRTAPERAEAAFEAISEAGRDAMTQLRRMLGVLREDGPAATCAPLEPQPGVGELPALMERVRASGSEVSYTVTGSVRTIPSDVGAAVHRIAQEALTNTVKHAPASPVTVELNYGTRELTLVVTDCGGGDSVAAPSASSPWSPSPWSPLPWSPSPWSPSPGGFGLVGIRERAAAHGGSARTGPAPGGRGFRVSATIPFAFPVQEDGS
ncbi:sensor histidine kinase [Streptomyces sp. NPDC002690]